MLWKNKKCYWSSAVLMTYQSKNRIMNNVILPAYLKSCNKITFTNIIKNKVEKQAPVISTIHNQNTVIIIYVQSSQCYIILNYLYSWSQFFVHSLLHCTHLLCTALNWNENWMTNNISDSLTDCTNNDSLICSAPNSFNFSDHNYKVCSKSSRNLSINIFLCLKLIE
jgi:hypothetical protein